MRLGLFVICALLTLGCGSNRAESAFPASFFPPALCSSPPLRWYGEPYLRSSRSPRILDGLAPLRGGAEEAAVEPPVERTTPCIIDLTGDRGVLKLTTHPGQEGMRPVANDEVYVLFNGSIECLDNHSTTFNGKNISGIQFDSTSLGPGASLPRSFQVCMDVYLS